MKTVEEKAVNTIRFLSVDAIEKAKSGHPGLPMGGATMAYVLWSEFLKHNPAASLWPDRDRFILSAGHGSMLLYSLLHLFGYGLTLEDLKEFRSFASKTPGHPEYGHTVGVETTTGPLGQGFANAVGMAIAEERLAAEFNRPGFNIVDHYTYVYAGDGCLMEGISAEAASLAGHLGLGKLICLYDDNEITIDGPTGISFSEDVGMRFEACNWQVISVADGEDREAIREAIAKAKKETNKPSLLMIKTIIGFGSPGKQGKSAAHGSPLGEEEVRKTKENLGWPPKPSFFIPEDVQKHFEALSRKGQESYQEWLKLFNEYKEKYPQEAKKWEEWHSGKIAPQLKEEASLWKYDKKVATRAASGAVLQTISQHVPNLMGGSADLTPSTVTFLKEKGVFQKDNPAGNNIHYGVREHAMGAISNGLILHGGLKSFTATFLVFSDYMKPAIRMAALSKVPSIFVFTHDSVAVGEDGPTHQPIEHLAMLRSIPNLHVLRPADGRETAAAWLHALERQEGPTAIILTRQGVQQLAGTGLAAHKGAYPVGRDSDNPDVILLASGSEVGLAVEVQALLADKDVDARVVSMISWELFRAQPADYREKILPAAMEKRIAIEAGHPIGWESFVGDRGLVKGIADYGFSAPGAVVLEKLGFTAPALTKMVLDYLSE